jgi:hypothetical protein
MMTFCCVPLKVLGEESNSVKPRASATEAGTDVLQHGSHFPASPLAILPSLTMCQMHRISFFPFHRATGCRCLRAFAESASLCLTHVYPQGSAELSLFLSCQFLCTLMKRQEAFPGHKNLPIPVVPFLKALIIT